MLPDSNDNEHISDYARLERMHNEMFRNDDQTIANTVIVKCLPSSITKEVLARHFHGCGSIRSIHLHVKQHGTYAFVEFARQESVGMAMGMNGKVVIDGRRVVISRKKVFKH